MKCRQCDSEFQPDDLFPLSAGYCSYQCADAAYKAQEADRERNERKEGATTSGEILRGERLLRCNLIYTTCSSRFIDSPDYYGSESDKKTDSDIRCILRDGHRSEFCADPQAAREWRSGARRVDPLSVNQPGLAPREIVFRYMLVGKNEGRYSLWYGPRATIEEALADAVSSLKRSFDKNLVILEVGREIEIEATPPKVMLRPSRDCK